MRRVKLAGTSSIAIETVFIPKENLQIDSIVLIKRAFPPLPLQEKSDTPPCTLLFGVPEFLALPYKEKQYIQGRR